MNDRELIIMTSEKCFTLFYSVFTLFYLTCVLFACVIWMFFICLKFYTDLE